jgi:hypothetical protein
MKKSPAGSRKRDPSKSVPLPPDAALREKLGLVTSEECRALFGNSPGAFANRVSRGDLPAYFKIGNVKLFKLIDVQEFLARHRVDPKSKRGRYQRGPGGSYRLRDGVASSRKRDQAKAQEVAP